MNFFGLGAIGIGLETTELEKGEGATPWNAKPEFDSTPIAVTPVRVTRRLSLHNWSTPSREALKCAAQGTLS